MDLEYWRAVKKQKKLTIEEIAKRANLPKGSVQNIFAGYVKNPRIDTVEAIEKALEINMRGNEIEEIEIKNVSVNPLEYELLNAFKEIGSKYDEETQLSIVSMIKKML